MTSRLTEQDRAQLQKNLDVLDRLGGLVGGWYGKGTTTCRRRSVTLTIGFDNEINPFDGDEFVQMMLLAPSMLGPTIRRLLALDDECGTPPEQAEGDEG
jgi:hypothetical protein